MTLAIILLSLRILSALLLLALVGVLFLVLWSDFSGAMDEVEASRRVYGYLIGLKDVEGTYTPSGEMYPLLPTTTLGRAPTNTIRLDDQFTSSEHAMIVLRSGVWWLEDVNSSNGTNLNGLTINQPVIVTNGDIINIGSHHFRLELDSA